MIAPADLVGTRLLDAWPAQAPICAVIGLGKNVGKTVVVGSLITACAQREEPLAILSLGRDGEAFDGLDDRLKPAVTLAPQMLAVVARAMLSRYAEIEVLREFDVQSAVGPLVLIRALAMQAVEIVGPRTANDIQSIIVEIRRFHAGRICIDGALDRFMGLRHINPVLIVAVGAQANPQRSELLRAAEKSIAQFRIPPMVNEAGVGGDVYDAQDAVLDEITAAQLLNDATIQIIVVASPYALTSGAFALLRRRKKLRVRQPAQVIACSINSVARGWSFAPEALQADLAGQCGVFTVDCFRNRIAA